jgi:ParB family chromosome partitioning protein
MAKKKPMRVSSFQNANRQMVEKQKQIQEAITKNMVTMVNIDKINPPKYHDRTTISLASIQELAQNIKATNGLIQPIVLREIENGKYERISGYRRIEAYKYLQKKEIEAIILKDIDDSTALLMMVSENIQREDLNAYDETVALLQYIAVTLGVSIDETKSFLYKIKNYSVGKISTIADDEETQKELIDEILEKSGKYKFQAFIDRLRLLNINPIIIEDMRLNKLSYSIAIEVNKIKDEEKIVSLLKEIKASRLTLSEVKERVKLLTIPKKPKAINPFASVTKMMKAQNYNKLDSTQKQKVDKLINELENLLNQ